ncbi:hypothetical protein TWF281_001946 [Arthrobotrys megalospora]
MCLRIIEVYPVCRCVHHIHAVDFCRLAGQPGHVVEDRVLGLQMRHRVFEEVLVCQSTVICQHAANISNPHLETWQVYYQSRVALTRNPLAPYAANLWPQLG